MHCDLLIPDLAWNPPGETATLPPLPPALSRLLARGRRRRDTGCSPEAWLCRAFGVERRGDWPVAPFSLLADGGEPGGHYWLRAEPVHLEVRMTQVFLRAAAGSTLTRDEADACVDLLNGHFEGAGMHFVAPTPQRWYVRLDQPADLATHALQEVADRNINNYLPKGTAGLRWSGIINEVQMLFHEMPVNQAREACGVPAINSVWVWGGGSLPERVASPYDSVAADDSLARGLALAAGAELDRLDEADRFLTALPGRRTGLVVLDGLRQAALRGSVEARQQALDDAEARWAAPLESALRSGRLKSLALHGTGADECLVSQLTRSDLWKFWRR